MGEEDTRNTGQGDLDLKSMKSEYWRNSEFFSIHANSPDVQRRLIQYRWCMSQIALATEKGL